jgi:WxL domain surface cell wall-binding
MRTATKTICVVTAGAILLSLGLAPANADTTESTVSGGALAATTSGATLSGVTLNGTSTQTATGTASEWTITDARGTGAEWTLSVSATAFTSAAGTVETTPRTIPVGALAIAPGAVTAASGSDAAAGITASDLTLSGTPQALLSAAGPHKGTYHVTPSFTLTVPANAYRSNYSGAVGGSPLNPYVSTLTYTIG